MINQKPLLFVSQNISNHFWQKLWWQSHLRKLPGWTDWVYRFADELGVDLVKFENWWPMMISLQDISSSFIFTRHMGRWKKQNKVNWTWMMTDEILLTKLIVSRWLVFKSFTYIFIILHSASVCFSTTPSFQVPDTKKNATNIRAGSPLHVVTSSLMMLRRRPFPSAYSGFGWFRPVSAGTWSQGHIVPWILIWIFLAELCGTHFV